jgi:hypothetical protein
MASAGQIGSIADPLTISDQHCRTCGCTDDRACFPTCSWVDDPLGLGDLCSRCLAIAVSVTDGDFDAGAYPTMRVVPALEEQPGLSWRLLGVLMGMLAGGIVGAIAGFLLGRVTP